jgi:hypothetical protein
LSDAESPQANGAKKALFTHPILDKAPSDLLERAYDVFKLGMKNVSLSVSCRLPNDSQAVADVAWIKVSIFGV